MTKAREKKHEHNALIKKRSKNIINKDRRKDKLKDINNERKHERKKERERERKCDRNKTNQDKTE